MKPVKKITVLLADDHTIVLQGLCKLLESDHDIKVVGQAVTGREAVALAQKLRPDIIIMDIAMPLLNGLEATRQILQANPAAKVLILSGHSDDAYIERTSALGAVGYLIKQTTGQFLAEAIREVAKGNTYFSPSITERRLAMEQKSASRKGRPAGSASRLTAREAEVLQLVAEGKSNKQVATELDISIKTVEKHRDHLMQKLGIHDTAGLTRYAVEIGVIQCSTQIPID